MIFTTCGSAPFPRLLRLMESLREEVDEEVVAQAAGDIDRYAVAGVNFLSFTAYRETVDDARVVVGHAGVGTILTSLEFDTPVIVVPRRAEYDEHIDNHQVQTARNLAAEGLVAMAESRAEVRAFIADPPTVPERERRSTLGEHIQRVLKQLDPTPDER